MKSSVEKSNTSASKYKLFLLAAAFALSQSLQVSASANPNGHPGHRGFSTVTPFRAPDPGVPVEVPTSNAASHAAPAAAPNTIPPPLASILNQPIVNTGAIAPTDAIHANDGFKPLSNNLIPSATMNINTALPETSLLHVHSSASKQPEQGQSHQILINRLDHTSLKTVPEGNSMLRPETDLALPTEFGTLKIPARSAVLLSLTRHSFSVYTLHENAGERVEVISHGKHLRVNQGTQLTLTNDLRSSFSEINPLSAIKHKELKIHSLRNGMVSFSGVFSIASALMSIEVLRNDPSLQKAADAQELTYGSL